MERSLLFPSSLIFDDSTLVDRARQAIIDLKFDPPPKEEGIPVFHQAIDYLKQDIDFTIKVEIIPLVVALVKQYPELFKDIMQICIKKDGIKPEIIGATAAIITECFKIPKIAGIINQHCEREFFDDVLEEIVPQFLNEEQGDITIYGNKVHHDYLITFLVQLLSIPPLNVIQITRCIEKLFKLDKDPQSYNMSKLLKILSYSRLTNLIPFSVFSENESAFFEQEKHFVVSYTPYLPSKFFKENYPKILSIIMSLPLPDQPTIVSILLKFKNEEILFKNRAEDVLIKFLSTLEAKHITKELWEYFAKIDSRKIIPSSINKTITPDMIFDHKLFFILLPDISVLSDEQINSIFEEPIDSIRMYEAILYKDTTFDQLKNIDFWIKFFTFFGEHVDQGIGHVINRAITVLTKLFREPQELASFILDIYLNKLPHKNTLFSAVISDTFIQNRHLQMAFTSHPKAAELLTKITEPPNESFWSSFNNTDLLGKMITQFPERSPIFVEGISIVVNVSQTAHQLASVDILPQDETSTQQLADYMDRVTNGDKSSMAETNPFSMPALSVFAAANLFSNNCTQRNFQPKFEGITREVSLPFFFIICYNLCDIMAERGMSLSQIFQCESFKDLNINDLFKVSLPLTKLDIAGIKAFLHLFAKKIKRMLIDPDFFTIMIDLVYPLCSPEFKGQPFIPYLIRFLLSLTPSIPAPEGILNRTQPIQQSIRDALKDKEITFTTTIIENIEYYIEFQKQNKVEYKEKFNVSSIIGLKNDMHKFLSKQIIETKMEFIYFVEKYCVDSDIGIEIPPPIVEKIISMIDKAVEENRKEDFTSLISFLVHNHHTETVLNFITTNYEKLPKELTSIVTRLVVLSHNQKARDIIPIESLLSIILYEEIPEPSNYMCNFINLLILDSSMMENLYRQCIDKMYDRFSITYQALIQTLGESLQKNSKEFLRAVAKMYVRPPPGADFMLIQQPVLIPMLPNSEFLDNLITVLLDKVTTEPTVRVFEALIYIASSLPYSFLSLKKYSIEVIIDLCLKNINEFENYLNSAEKSKDNDELFKQASTPVVLLYFLCYSPDILDIFVPYVLKNISTFTPNQIFGISLLIRVFIEIPSVQTIVYCLMLKYNWNEQLSNILEIKYSPDLKFGKLLQKQLLSITNDFIQFITYITPQPIGQFEIIQTLEKPFRQVLDDTLVTRIGVDRRFFPLSYLHLYIRPELDNWCALIQQDRYVSLQGSDMIPESFLADLSKHTLPPVVKIPDCIPVNKEAFEQLPTAFKSTILFHMLPPKPQEINPAMKRFLVTAPTWVSNWVRNSPSLLLLPEHYYVLYPILLQLNELQNAEDPILADDFIIDACCQGRLYEQLIDLMIESNSKTTQLFINNILSLSKNNFAAFIGVLDIINNKLSTATISEVKCLLGILSQLCNAEFFKDLFPDNYEPMYNAVTNPYSRTHHTILNTAALILANLGDRIPTRALQVFELALLQTNINSFDKILSLCSKLPESIRETLTPYIDIAFNKTLDEVIANPSKIRSNFAVFLKEFPSICKSRQPKLLEFLDSLLKNFNEKNLPIIGPLFKILCPERNDSKSIHNDSTSLNQVNEEEITNIVPATIFQQAPEFWKIVQDNMNLLTDLISAHPELITTDLNFFTNYPEVLTLKPRIDMFRGAQMRKLSNKVLTLRVRRSNILNDSFNRLRNVVDKQLLCRLSVVFINEPGIDAGGVRRDWFSSLAKELLNPDYVLFSPSSNFRSHQPNPCSYIENDHIEYFKFAGRIIARALIEGMCIDAHLTKSLLKHILGYKMTLRDLEDVDEELHRSLTWILENDPVEVEQYFVADFDEMGVHKTIELKKGGTDILVTNENKEEYVNLMVQHRLESQIKPQINAFLEGFYGLIPKEEIRIFRPDELDLLICGVPEIDIEDLRANANIMHPYNPEHPVIQRFFNVIFKFSQEDKAKLLLFITGSSQVPVGGFKVLRSIHRPIQICGGGSNKNLPVAHTCNNQLDLPPYETEEEMEGKLLYAIKECNYFGFA